MIIYTQGSYDILHRGHIILFSKCRKLAGKDGKVIVSVLSDESYLKYRGHPPAKIFEDRKATIESCRYVDLVIEGNNRKTKQEIKKYKVDIVVVGSDWASKNIYKQYRMKADELDPLLVYNPYFTKISSTIIKERIINGVG